MAMAALPDLNVLSGEALRALILAQHCETWTRFRPHRPPEIQTGASDGRIQFRRLPPRRLVPISESPAATATEINGKESTNQEST
jgi:hypothetical protein